jgi:hypothetical protein
MTAAPWALPADLPDRRPLSPPERPRAAAYWRFVSPSFLVLALVTLPLPWLEVRCASRNQGPTREHYSQTGLQILAGRCTNHVRPAPASARQPRAAAPVVATSTPGEYVRPARLAVSWLWVLTALVAAGCGLAARTFTPALLNLIFSAATVVLMLALFVVVVFEEALNSISITYAPLAALMFCVAATAGSVTALMLRPRARPLRYRDPEEDED